MNTIDAKSFNCPSCGGHLQIEHAYTKTVVCQYCDTVSSVIDKTLNPSGKMAKLSEAPSIFSVGSAGALRGKRFEILGRLRYTYPSGFWDEWYLKFEDGKAGWLTEEEGECTLFFKTQITDAMELDHIAIAKRINISGRSVFITEIQNAVISGGEGQLNYVVVPGASVRHIEGIDNGTLVSVEIWDNEIELHTGSEIGYEEITVEKKVTSEY